MKRVIFDVFLTLSLFTMPWLVTLILVFVGIFVFKQYYEFIVTWVIMFFLFAIPGDRQITHETLVFVTIGVVYVGIQTLKRYMILYKNEI